MTVTQLRHFKLWFAQRVENWELANYELIQLRNTVNRIVILYPNIGSFAQATLIREKTAPEIDALSDSITKKDSKSFEVTYGRITNACNECHQAAGVEFIKVRVPTSSPFSNQIFEPQQ